MRPTDEGTLPKPAPTHPQPQGPPNYPGAGGRANLNPPFDPRMLSTGGANPALKDRPMKRGRIVAVEGGLQVNFMFNPSVLEVSFTGVADIDQNKADQGQEGGVNPDLVGQSSLGLDLLFDRTYEVWERKATITGKFGVHADILAFWAYLGMIPPGYDVATSWESLYPNSQIVRVNSYLYVGDRLKFYGYITSMTVQYVHWSYDMVPVRAALNLGFTVLLTTPTSGTGDDSNSGSTTAPPTGPNIPNPNKPDPTKPNTSRPDPTKPNTSRPDPTKPGG